MIADVDVVARPCRDDVDWWRVRQLLVETMPTTPPSWNWDVRRWDAWRFHSAEPLGDVEMAAGIRLWEAIDGRLLGAAHPDRTAEAVLELRPDARWLEEPMIRWAEARLAMPTGPGGTRRLAFAVRDDDLPRRAVLERRGYRMLDTGGWLRWMRLGPTPTRSRPMPRPYAMRSTVPGTDDAGRIAHLLNAAFGRTGHSAAEVRTFMERSPSFDHALNLVAVAPDGSFGAHVGVTVEPVNRHAIVEPVCTHPDHRRRGLARVLILEGLRRASALGATTASVETGDGEAANALYVACGFAEADHYHAWRVDLP